MYEALKEEKILFKNVLHISLHTMCIKHHILFLFNMLSEDRHMTRPYLLSHRSHIAFLSPIHKFGESHITNITFPDALPLVSSSWKFNQRVLEFFVGLQGRVHK